MVTARRESLKPTTTTMPETNSAAMASAICKMPLKELSAGRYSLACTQSRPTSTTPEDQMSVVKCRASASSAWLLCFWATRRSMAARLTSTSREMRMMITPHHDGVISGASKKSRLTASCTIQPQVTSSRTVSASAERFSILP